MGIWMNIADMFNFIYLFAYYLFIYLLKFLILGSV